MAKRKILQLLQVQSRPWTARYFKVVLLVGAVLAMVASLAIGMNQSVWFDEAYSILLARQPTGELLRLTGLDTHPPLYYLLLKAWAGIFGFGELALRSLSVLAMGGSVVLAGLLARRLFGVRVAVAALPFVALAPFLLRYGFEIRMYAVASLVGIAATYVLVRALAARGRQQWLLYALYAVLVALGVYTLYYMVLLWVAHFVWLVWLAYRRTQPLAKAPWLLAYIGSVALFVPWLPTFLSQVGNGALAPISQALTLENLLGILSFNFVYQPVWQLDALTSLLMVFVLVGASYFTIRAFKLAGRGQRQYLLLLTMYVLVPVAILAIVSLLRPMYVERYLAHVAIGGLLLVGVSVAIVTKNSRLLPKAMAALLPVVMLVGVAHLAQVGNYNFQRLQKPTVDQVAAALGECKNSAVILAADPYLAIELAYYMPHCLVHFYSETPQLAGGYAPLAESPLRVEDPKTQLADEDKILYVYYGKPQLLMPKTVVPAGERTYSALTVAAFSAE